MDLSSIRIKICFAWVLLSLASHKNHRAQSIRNNTILKCTQPHIFKLLLTRSSVPLWLCRIYHHRKKWTLDKIPLWFHNIQVRPLSEVQRLDRIRITGVNSGRVLHFSFESGTGVKNLWKKRIRSHFSISAGVCAVISLVKTWVNYGWIDDCSRSLNRSRILKFEKQPDPDSKILE